MRGHGAAPLEPLDGAMLLRTTRMRHVDVDPAARTARADAGAVWQDVIVPAAEHGLAGLAGSSPNVGVTGYTLGGGIGFLARRYGLAANSVTAAELVTPGGEAACLGDAGTGAELIGPLRRLGPERDTFAMIPASALGQLNMDPSQPVAGEGDGAFLADLPAAAIDALVAVAGPDAQTPPDSVEVRHLGGALARPAPGGGAQPSIDASYLLYAAGATPTPSLAGPVHAHVQALKDALVPWHASYDYYNFEDTPAPAAAVLPPASYRRLQEIKASYDPDQAIISAHPVWPTRPRHGAPGRGQP